MSKNSHYQHPGNAEATLTAIAFLMFIMGVSAPIPVIALIFIERLSLIPIILLSIGSSVVWFGTAWGLFVWSEKLGEERLRRYYGSPSYDQQKPGIIEVATLAISVILVTISWVIATKSLMDSGFQPDNMITGFNIAAGLLAYLWWRLRHRRLHSN